MALGQPAHYLEPFFGSGAVLLARPNYDPAKHTETICDKDGFICNVWRAITFQPEEVAKWCDWPVNHVDLMARRKALLKNEQTLVKQLVDDDTWCDPVMAGYWIWAASCWICDGLTRPNAIPRLKDKGGGIQNTGIQNTLLALQSRLRRVRVVCGDWNRICGGNWQDSLGPCGIFIDPPYGAEDCEKVYSHDGKHIAAGVRRWCKQRGGLKNYKIVLAGYAGEGHEELEAEGWRAHRYKGPKGYASNNNRERETLWMSPYCFRVFDKPESETEEAPNGPTA